jgi:hypothetical protein
MIAYSIVYLICTAIGLDEFSWSSYVKGIQTWGLRVISLEGVAAVYFLVLAICEQLR